MNKYIALLFSITILLLIGAGLFQLNSDSIPFSFSPNSSESVNNNVRLETNTLPNMQITVESDIPIKNSEINKSDAIESDSNSQDSEMLLFQFNGEEPFWYTVNDDVMGGISSSFINFDENSDILTFSGNLSLENNGGFASIRSQWTNYELENYDGITFRVLGDGKTYRFRIRTEEAGSNISYTALFPTEANIWKEIYVPFSEMLPLYRGFVVSQAGPLDPGSIRSFGFMLSDKQTGEFKLEVENIRAVIE